VKQRIFTPEESHTLHEMRHAAGVLTLRFRDHKTGEPGKFEYDYPDADGAHYAALDAAGRPGTEARLRIKTGLLVHAAKRDASAQPVETATVEVVSNLAIVQPPPDPVKVEIASQAQDIAARIPLMQVRTWPEHAAMVECLKGVKALREKAELHHRPLITKAHGLWKDLLGALQSVDDPLKAAEAEGKRRCLAFEDADRRAREEEARRLRLEAERIAREAQEAAEAEARRLRQIQEQEAAEAREREIEAAEANGATAAEVQAIIEQPVAEPEPVYFAPVVVPMYIPPPPPPKTTGASTARPWKAAVDTPADLLLLIRHVAAHPEYSNLLQLNQTALNALAKAQGANLRLPGVRSYQDAQMRVGK